jgi:hypothetical protein
MTSAKADAEPTIPHPTIPIFIAANLRHDVLGSSDTRLENSPGLCYSCYRI